eukprot:GHVT01028272.1.p1 GENE.GHVT01028272.1~~GHVT01028272.1.p1  ORF type:complete len:155 (-),score=19.84 GHVT01028272.1:507-971(-)
MTRTQRAATHAENSLLLLERPHRRRLATHAEIFFRPTCCSHPCEHFFFHVGFPFNIFASFGSCKSYSITNRFPPPCSSPLLLLDVLPPPCSSSTAFLNVDTAASPLPKPSAASSPIFQSAPNPAADYLEGSDYCGGLEKRANAQTAVQGVAVEY